MNTTDTAPRYRVQYSCRPPMPGASEHRYMDDAVDAAREVLSRLGEEVAVAEIIGIASGNIERRYTVDAQGIVRRSEL